MPFQLKHLTLLLLICIATQAAAQKQLLYSNSEYEPTIKTVQLYPKGNSVQAVLDPPVTQLNGRKPLVLEFDDLKEDAEYYFVKLIHCNADWEPSSLRPTMYLNAFNRFEIEDFEFSSEAKVNYVHYRFTIPSVKYSGNYLAVVYRDRDEDDIVLSRQFMVYYNKVAVGGNIQRSASVGERLRNQRVEVTLNYNGLKSINPNEDFKVVVRQNQRADKLKRLKATFINESDQLLRFQNLGTENDFKGGNEFRFFDISTINFSGRNVDKIGFKDNEPYAELRTDQERSAAYLQTLDINGSFFSNDNEGRASDLTGEYVQVKFNLDFAEINDPIYVLGAFNGWQKNDASQMKYDLLEKKYTNTIQLKQGWYDYQYITESCKPWEIEKSFFETENQYEIFVYYTAIGTRGDQLVGYQRINYNARR